MIHSKSSKKKEKRQKKGNTHHGFSLDKEKARSFTKRPCCYWHRGGGEEEEYTHTHNTLKNVLVDLIGPPGLWLGSNVVAEQWCHLFFYLQTLHTTKTYSQGKKKHLKSSFVKKKAKLSKTRRIVIILYVLHIFVTQ